MVVSDNFNKGFGEGDGNARVIQVVRGEDKRVVVTTGVVSTNSTYTTSINLSNRAKITEVRVTASASTDFDFSIYEKNTYSDEYLAYLNENNNKILRDLLNGLDYKDYDNTAKLHVKIDNNDGVNASTFRIEVCYISLE